MNREAKHLPIATSSNQLESATGRKVILYVDTKFEKKLRQLLSSEAIRKKFRMVAEFALSDRYRDDIYGHEDISKIAKDVCAIKIYVLGNHRIYCKEFFATGIKRIVLIKYVDKKTMKVSKDIKQMIEQIGGYSYEFES